MVEKSNCIAGEWLHVSLAWFPAVPRIYAYYDGEPQVVSGNTWRAAWPYVHQSIIFGGANAVSG